MINYLQKYKEKIIWLCFFVIIGLTIILPRRALDFNLTRHLNKLESVPEEIFIANKTSMAKRTSRLLSPIDKMKMVTGAWECIQDESTQPEPFLTEAEAVSLAKEQIEYMYSLKLYPFSLKSDSDNWYQWNTECFCYKETSFHTYTSYLWVINFEKYDNSLSHTIFMTEDGVILYASSTDKTVPIKSFSQTISNDVMSRLLKQKCRMTKLEETKEYNNLAYIMQYIYPVNTMAFWTDTNSYKVSLDTENNTKEEFLFFQMYGTKRYSIGILPISATEKIN